MNIAIVTTWFPAGAGYVSKAYQKILEKEHNIFIYARGGQVMKSNPEWDQPNVTWAPRHYNGIKTNHFIKWLKKNKINIAFFNEQRYWKPVLAAKKAGLCIGAYIDYYTQKTVPAFGVYDFLICNTKRHYSVFDWHPNAYYIPWGTDIEKYNPKPNQKHDVPTFIISAGWEPLYSTDRRGSLLALKAFKEVTGKCKLIIYSQVNEDKLSGTWKDLKKNDERIKLKTGTFDPFPYTNGDVYLYPSRLDGIGLTLPEAVSSGLAAITTNSGPMNEFVANNYNGVLVNVERHLGRSDGYYWAESICNLDGLKDAIQLYIDNPGLMREHKKNSRKLAQEKLDWSKNALNISEIFTHNIQSNSYDSHFNIIPYLVKLDKIYSPSLNYRILLLLSDIFNRLGVNVFKIRELVKNKSK